MTLRSDKKVRKTISEKEGQVNNLGWAMSVEKKHDLGNQYKAS